MRNPQLILECLSKHSNDNTYKYSRLYRLLYNEELFYVAYQKIYAKQGNMTRGINNATIDDMTNQRILSLIEKLRDETYQPTPFRRTYIKKKNGKLRPLGIPTFDDKLVQEVVRIILECIYEGHFEDTSHGFRPNRSCHTAISHIVKHFTGTKWFIEGDIKSFFDNIDHNILINILRERITDERFLRLIRKFLKAGYMEEWEFHKTYSGTPQGGIISPILANIYLDKLDKYIKEYAISFNIGEKRALNLPYYRLQDKITRNLNKARKALTEEDKNKFLGIVNDSRKEQRKLPNGDPMDENFKRLQYVRYADDFLIGIIGSKEDCRKVKTELSEFISSKLKLELSDEKTLITHASQSHAKFLNFEISVNNSADYKWVSSLKRYKRFLSGIVKVKMPKAVVKAKLIELSAMKINIVNGKEVWKPTSRRFLTNFDDLTILYQYNAEIRGLYNYYCIALNSSELKDFKYIMEYSMYNTFAMKYRCKRSEILDKYRKNGNFTITYKRKNNKENNAVFYNQGFRRKKKTLYSNVSDTKPNIYQYGFRTSLMERIKAEKCELCGAENVPIHMHHVRKVKDLKGKEVWEIVMLSMNRKTLAVCEDCHRKIHGWKEKASKE